MRHYVGTHLGSASSTIVFTRTSATISGFVRDHSRGSTLVLHVALPGGQDRGEEPKKVSRFGPYAIVNNTNRTSNLDGVHMKLTTNGNSSGYARKVVYVDNPLVK